MYTSMKLYSENKNIQEKAGICLTFIELTIITGFSLLFVMNRFTNQRFQQR
jgi:hypothetical protein